MRVIVVRTGGTWHGRGSTSAGATSTLTSQANHDAIARELVLGGHQVLCCGRIAGELAIEGAEQLSWQVRDQLGVEGNRAELDELCAEAEAWRPDVLVNVCGAEVTNVSPTNKRGNTIQATQWRYYWPAHVLMERLRLPRIIVVTDCRCYPREQEMLDDEWALPAAVLSQEQRTIVRRVLDRRLECRAVYAGIERFRLRDVEVWEPRGTGIIALAHAHMADKRISRGKQEAWAALTKRECFTDPIDAVGAGWEYFDDSDSALDSVGHVPHWKVQETLAWYAVCPLMPMRHGWLSPKLGECARAGCMPLPHGRGGPLTYDWCDELGRGMVVNEALDALRVWSPQWLRVASEMSMDERRRWCAMVVEATRPDPSLLLECVEHFGSGGGMVDKYGGMRWDSLTS